jgi:PIN domain nuclease of toxin-antitoxin system
MPLFGLEPPITNLKKQFLELLRQKRFIFYYSPVSIIEIKWQMIKLSRSGYDGDLLEQKFSQALTSLKEDTRYRAVDFLDAKLNDLSYELRKLGHNDYFDTIIASSALWESEKLITEDNPLKIIIQEYFNKNKDSAMEKIEILTWEEFFDSATAPLD